MRLFIISVGVLTQGMAKRVTFQLPPGNQQCILGDEGRESVCTRGASSTRRTLGWVLVIQQRENQTTPPALKKLGRDGDQQILRPTEECYVLFNSLERPPWLLCGPLPSPGVWS